MDGFILVLAEERR